MKYETVSILNSFGVNSWKPVILGDFLQKKGDIESELLQKLWNINAHNNEQFTIKH